MSHSNSSTPSPASSSSSSSSSSPASPPTTNHAQADPPSTGSPSPSPSSTPTSNQHQPPQRFFLNPTHKRPPKRPTTLYDAVAGRISTSGFLVSHSHARAHAYASRHRDTASSSLTPLPPEEVLFRRKRAPVRFLDDEGGDWYFADERDLCGVAGKEGDGKRLPASELVGAVHGYVSGFYGRLGEVEAEDRLGGGERWVGGDWRSMDETALLAVGILLEEEVARVLGGSGDLVFVEGEWGAEAVGEDGRGRKKKEEGRGAGVDERGMGKRERKGKRRRKRRKIGKGKSEGEGESEGEGMVITGEEGGSVG